jgi:pimeloyl-ACP methyl ester carboxylesterase
VDVELKTVDGWSLKGKYLASKSSTTVVVLLHGTGQRKEVWYHLGRYLARAGYGYLALDLRGHGESLAAPDGQQLSWRKFKATKNDNDFANMSLDIQAAVTWLVSAGIPEEGIGLIGTDVGGSVAIKYAAVHPHVPFVVMLSPGMSYQEVLTVNAVRAYKDRPILMVYSDADKNSARATPILYEFAKRSVGELKASVVMVPRIHGVRIPMNGPAIRQIIAWIKSPVKPEVPAFSSAAVEQLPLPVEGSRVTIDTGLGPEGPDGALPEIQ